jgi:hypothetical protein
VGQCEGHRARAAAKIQDPCRSHTAEGSLHESWAPPALAHHHRVDPVVERREERAAGRWDVSIVHVYESRLFGQDALRERGAAFVAGRPLPDPDLSRQREVAGVA